MSVYISQIMICGDSLKNCTVAVVTPDEEKINLWAEQNGKESSAAYEDPDFKAEILDDIALVA